MNRLPQDILVEIAALLQGPHFELPALATVSRQWQAAIERQTFRKICLKSTDLDRFEETVRNSRRGYVNVIDYHIILPPFSDDERWRFEREDSRQANDEVFTAAIHRLFNSLRHWDVSEDGYIELYLGDVYSSSDHQFLRRSSPFFKMENIHNWHRGENNSAQTVDLWTWRFRYSFLRLLRAPDLPMVPVVKSFSTTFVTRNMDDRVPIDMAARMPSLHEASWVMNDWEIRYIGLRRMHRLDLAQAVTQVLPQSSGLQSLTLNMRPDLYWTPAFSAGSLNSESPGPETPDTLSDAIRSATEGIRTLRKLRVVGIFDESLLWPGPKRSPPEPYWQNIERLIIHFHTRRPSGGCYFRGSDEPLSQPSETEMPPGYQESGQDDAQVAIHFSPHDHLGFGARSVRVAADDGALEPLMEAFGRACVQMPMLKLAQLVTSIPAPAQLDSGRYISGEGKWGVYYLSPGTLFHRPAYYFVDPAFRENVHQRRLIWDVMDWRPSHDLQSLLGKIGEEKHGPNLVETFVDSWNTAGKKLFLQE